MKCFSPVFDSDPEHSLHCQLPLHPILTTNLSNPVSKIWVCILKILARAM